MTSFPVRRHVVSSTRATDAVNTEQHVLLRLVTIGYFFIEREYGWKKDYGIGTLYYTE